MLQLLLLLLLLLLLMVNGAECGEREAADAVGSGKQCERSILIGDGSCGRLCEFGGHRCRSRVVQRGAEIVAVVVWLWGGLGGIGMLFGS